MHLNLKSWALPAAVLVAVISLGSCKKTKYTSEDILNPVVPHTTNRDELDKDSIYLYALQTYYWNTSLPAYSIFNPRKFSSTDDELFALTQYSLNPATGKSYEYSTSHPTYPKYSFIDNGGVASQLGGTGGDYGFSVFFAATNDLRVKYVYGGSPADTKSLKRGYQVIKINGRTDLATTSSGISDFLNAAIFGTNATIDLTLKKPDGSSFDASVPRGNYSLNPILYTNVYTAGTKKVGYIVFNSFTTNAEAKLTDAIASFAAQNVTELVVDLRYNGGGSVQTSELFANLLAPASASGSTMYDTYFNSTMQNGQATILKNQKFYYNNQIYSLFDLDYSVAGFNVKFAKSGSLNVNRIYFIVTGGTASASELLINNLKPVVDVKLIGKKTYGKPVGFFTYHIHNFDLYIPQFETKNKLGAGGYYDGIDVDKEDVDDVTKDFGDPSEKLLSYALTYATKGAFSQANPKDNTFNNVSGTALSTAEIDRLTNELDANQFKGMVRERLPLKKIEVHP